MVIEVNKVTTDRFDTGNTILTIMRDLNKTPLGDLVGRYVIKVEIHPYDPNVL